MNGCVIRGCLVILILTALLGILSCSDSGNGDGDLGSIVGFALRSGSTDHSGITVSLFGLASSDPDVDQVLNQYPSIGFAPSQSCLFDHRVLQTVSPTMTTDSDGRFAFDDLSQADYNVVAEDSGYGYRYALRMQVRGGETRTDTLTLYPIEQPPTQITQNTTWESGHHYRITQNTTVMPGVQLTIEPGVMVRFVGYRRIDILGTLSAVGESNQFIHWIGDDTSQTWNQVNLQSTSSTLSQVTWCLFDGATAGIVNDGSTLSIQSSYFKNCTLSGASFTNVSFVDVENCIFVDQHDGSGVGCSNVSGGYVHFNLFVNNYRGVNCTENAFLTIENNWIGHSYGDESSAIFMQYINSNSGDSLIIAHNQIEDCVWGIWVSGGVRSCTAIRYNNISHCEERAIRIYPIAGGASYPHVHRNNFLNIGGYCMELTLQVNNQDVNAQNNWWGTTNHIIIEQDLIYDGHDPGSQTGYILYNPPLSSSEASAGIQ